jgi:hypothetical protein
MAMHVSTAISILALFVSFLVLAVQYGQWRIARMKVAVDLFDRRFKVLTRIEDALRSVVQHGEVDTQSFNDFVSAQFDAQYLFGKDVQKFLQKYRTDLAWMHAYRDIRDDAPNREKLIDRKYECFNRIASFYENSPVLFRRYIGLDHKI